MDPKGRGRGRGRKPGNMMRELDKESLEKVKQEQEEGKVETWWSASMYAASESNTY